MAILVFVTAKDRDEARKIAKHLLDLRLIACANIIDGVESHYWWNQALEQSSEALMIMKSEKGKFAAIQKAVTEVHSYEVPEVISVSLDDGLPAYLKWIQDSLKG